MTNSKMQNQQHTPGPWSVDPVRGLKGVVHYKITSPQQKWCIANVTTTVCVEDDGRHTAEWYSIPQAKANAHLFAAAPELLDALQSLLGYFEHPSDWCDVNPVDVIKTAIAKATGKEI